MTNNEYDHAREILVERSGYPDSDPRRSRLRDEAITCCLPLARHIAQRYRDRGEPLDDLEQVARLGLVQAVDRFDPARKTDFLSFAIPTITGEVRRYFRDRSAAIRVPRSAKELNARIRHADEELSQQLHRAPRDEEIARHLNEPEGHIRDARVAMIAQSTIALDGADRDDDHSLLDVLESTEPGFDRVDNAEALVPGMKALPQRQRRIIGMRFFEERSQSDIADRLGISQMHVSRLLKKSLLQLRATAI